MDTIARVRRILYVQGWSVKKIVRELHVSPFAQPTTWVGFFLSSACSEDDTYPFNVRPDLSCTDGRQLMSPLHSGQTFPPGGASNNAATAW